MWFGTLTLPLVAVFASFMRNRMSPPYGDMFFFGVAAFVYTWRRSGLAHVDLAACYRSPRPRRGELLAPVLPATTLMTLAPAMILGLQEREASPRWLGVFSAIALAEQLVETITIFGDRGFTAPGGPMNNFLGAGLVAVSWLAIGIVVARGMNEQGPVSSSAS